MTAELARAEKLARDLTAALQAANRQADAIAHLVLLPLIAQAACMHSQVQRVSVAAAERSPT